MFNGSNDGMVMPVAPAYGAGFGGGYGNGGFLGGDGILALLLFALIFGNGWGGGFGGGWGGMMGMGMADGMFLYPWMNQADITTSGFQNQMLQSSIQGLQSSVTSGFGDVQTALCGGFAGVNASVNGAQNAISQQLYTNQIADLERSFNAQTAVTQGMNTIASNLQNCCCENRANIADLKYVVAQENCADRQALNEGVRDIIANQTAGIQRVLDKLCDQELYAERRENDQLRQQLNFANLQASQVAQTAELRTAAQTANANLLTELRNCPIPAQAVYGNQPVFTCSAQNNCGCGCGSF